jgi:5-methyltetrahydrofolate--homocysteine methyltransferase
LPIEEARARKFPIEWREEDIAVPSFLGRRVLPNFPLEEIVPFNRLDGVLHRVRMRGKYPKF